MTSTDSPLVALLTLVLRDHVSVGDMEQTVAALSVGGPYEFECPVTMQIATNFVRMLMAIEQQEAQRLADEPSILGPDGEKA